VLGLLTILCLSELSVIGVLHVTLICSSHFHSSVHVEEEGAQRGAWLAPYWTIQHLLLIAEVGGGVSAEVSPVAPLGLLRGDLLAEHRAVNEGSHKVNVEQCVSVSSTSLFN
jgi:hypothetical protein